MVGKVLLGIWYGTYQGAFISFVAWWIIYFAAGKTVAWIIVIPLWALYYVFAIRTATEGDVSKSVSVWAESRAGGDLVPTVTSEALHEALEINNSCVTNTEKAGKRFVHYLSGGGKAIVSIQTGLHDLGRVGITVTIDFKGNDAVKRAATYEGLCRTYPQLKVHRS